MEKSGKNQGKLREFENRNSVDTLQVTQNKITKFRRNVQFFANFKLRNMIQNTSRNVNFNPKRKLSTSKPHHRKMSTRKETRTEM